MRRSGRRYDGLIFLFDRGEALTSKSTSSTALRRASEPCAVKRLRRCDLDHCVVQKHRARNCRKSLWVSDGVLAMERESTGHRRTLGRYKDDGEVTDMIDGWKKALCARMARPWRGVVVLGKQVQCEGLGSATRCDVG